MRRGAYAYWALVGLLGALGLVGILTIGLPLLLLAAVLVVVGVRRPGLANDSAVASLAGGAVIPAWLAWMNRGGPGDVCTTTATSSECTTEWSPWPFAVVAVLLLVLPVALLWWGGRHRGEVTPP